MGTFRGIQREQRAIQDIIELATWIGQFHLDASERFIDAVDQTMADLAAMPMLGRQVDLARERLRPLRARAVAGFPDYLLFYEVTPTDIVVIRVLHGARDLPGLLD